MLTYTDAYLKSRVTQDIETRATAEIDAFRAFPTSPVNWRERLIVLRAYVLTCLEMSASPDDVFASKLTAYRKEYDNTLSSANAAANAANPASPQSGLYSINLERA
jgi:hypothetical protein